MAIYSCYYIFIIALFFASGRVFLSATALYGALTPGTNRRRTQDKWFMILATGGLVLILGLRGQDMGVDLVAYLPAFDAISGYSWQTVSELDAYMNFEKGFVVFTKIIGTLGQSKQVFLFACAALSIAPVGWLIYRYSKQPLISLLIYMGLPVFLLTFSGLRQTIAVGITALSFPFIQKKKPIPFILIVLFASLFHSSALTFLPAYVLYQIRIDRQFSFILVAALPIIWVLRVPLFNLLASFIGRNAVPDDNGAVTLFLVFTLVYLFCVYVGERDDAFSNGLRNLFWVACAIQAMGGVYSTVIRVGYYYMLYLTLLLPEVLNQTRLMRNEQQRRMLSVMISACFVAFGWYSLYRGSWAESYPYHFFWDTMGV